jgi:CheY-like chemotaxis protein
MEARSLNALIFDTNVSRAEGLRERILSSGGAARLVATEDQVLRALQGAEAALILIAADSRGGKGYSLCNRLRNAAGLGNVRVAMYGGDKDRRAMSQHAALVVRADQYIVLPFDEAGIQRLFALAAAPATTDSSTGQTPIVRTPRAQLSTSLARTGAMGAMAFGAIAKSFGVGNVASIVFWAGLAVYVAILGASFVEPSKRKPWRALVCLILASLLFWRIYGLFL